LKVKGVKGVTFMFSCSFTGRCASVSDLWPAHEVYAAVTQFTITLSHSPSTEDSLYCQASELFPSRVGQAARPAWLVINQRTIKWKNALVGNSVRPTSTCSASATSARYSV